MDQQKSAVIPNVVQILAIGDSNAEFVFPHLEKMPGFGREVVVPEMVTRAAGSAANFAICAASLGVKTGFAGRLAVDQFGEVVLKAFREVDVDTQCLRLVEDSSTGVTIAMIRDDGERAFVTFQGSNAQLKLEDLEVCLKQDPPPRWVHLAGYHLLDALQGQPSLALLELARSRGATTSFDSGWDPAGWSDNTIEEVKEILQLVDVFFPNADEVKALTGERSPRKGAQQLIEAGAPALVVKLGKKGCLLATKRDQHLIPAFDVKVQDTTAAGDAFNAGFAVSMVSGATMGRAAVFANAVAALRVSRQPDQTLFPSLQETTAFLMRKRPLET
ncbi:MAG: carbohydrate kinase family protein [Candidatus Hermodarchaeia archaeon]|jgi:ribokinase